MARRILIVGTNCQVAVLGGCFRFLAPDAEVASVEPSTLAHYESSPEGLLNRAAEADITVSMPFEEGPFGSVTPASLRESARVYIPLPSILFPAFHPDIVYIFQEGRTFSSPMGDYHSALIVYGFSQGFSVDETVSLFRPEVFAKVGYLDGWFRSRDSLLAMSRAHGFNLDRLFAGWMRRGCFMHTINHPKLFVLEDLARAALQSAGIPARAARCEDVLSDPLSGISWPVYPEIAARYSVPGSSTFKPPLGGFDFLRDATRCLDLQVMVEKSLTHYAQTPEIADCCDRIHWWLNKADVRETLRPVV